MSDAIDPMMLIENVCFSRGSKVIFSGLTLAIRLHQVTAIMGPSGTGKTTLLALMGAQLRPDSGSIRFEGKEITSFSRSAIYAMRRKMGVLFQGGALFTDLNVFENVAFPLREHTTLPEDMIRDLVLVMLEAVGLRGAASLQVDQLSGGMARRVALARAMVLGPDWMMYDEPFTGQDPIARGVLLKLIKEMNEALNLTSIIVSHDVMDTASIADYIYLIAEGRVVAEGEPAMLFNDPSPRVQQFVKGSPDGPMPFHYPAPPFHEEIDV